MPATVGATATPQTTPTAPSASRVTVRVMFGRHPIATQWLEPAAAARYAAAMRRRFPSLVVDIR